MLRPWTLCALCDSSDQVCGVHDAVSLRLLPLREGESNDKRFCSKTLAFGWADKGKSENWLES